MRFHQFSPIPFLILKEKVIPPKAIIVALKEEGLFRVSGNHERIQEIKELYDRGSFKAKLMKGKNVHLSGEDVATVTGILKLFFRELRDPIFTFELYPSFLTASGLNPFN